MIRYPGSKAKIAKLLIGRFPADVVLPLWQGDRVEYREPFFGGGAVGFPVLSGLPRSASVWLNDLDYGIVCMWNAVYSRLDELVDMIMRYEPRVDDFYEYKEQDLAGWRGIDSVEVGFRKFALHQISFSGNGVKAGGPIGGRKQRSEYNVDCRWDATRHALEARRLSRILRKFEGRVRITCRDFGELLRGAPESAFIYADPPYYKAGPQLYKHSFGDAEHRRLAESLRACRASWVLSYDDQPAIRQLYDWADIGHVELTYSTAVAKGRRRKNSGHHASGERGHGGSMNHKTGRMLRRLAAISDKPQRWWARSWAQWSDAERGRLRRRYRKARAWAGCLRAMGRLLA